MQRILGLDLGTNSIGWAIIEKSDESGKIVDSGSRIIPMDAETLGNFAKGNTVSQTKERTQKRSVRRIRERFLLRRERLHRILKSLGYLPQHYSACIGWDIEHDKKHFGNFLEGKEPKIAWQPNEDGSYDFLFKKSFEEMLTDFRKNHPEIKKVPYDWTLYYLRQKALSEPITNEELAWIILNFNQKRGYNQLRDEVDIRPKSKKEEFVRLKVKSVVADESSKGKNTWYSISFENSDIIYRRQSKTSLDNWVGTTRGLIVSTDLDAQGNPKLRKDGSPSISIKSPSEDDWSVIKLRTEQDINQSGKTVGQFIYESLLFDPDVKIKGRLVRTIERDFYKKELKQILQKQAEFHPELRDKNLYQQCILELYPNNEAHRQNICNGDFVSLILEDAIFYQRPLKSKKSLIDNCPYEWHKGIDEGTGEIKDFPNKCIAKSNPYFQEFRIWKFLSDLRIYANTEIVDGHIKNDVDVTSQFISDDNQWDELFVWLNDKKDVEQKDLLKKLGIKDLTKYRWNYVADKRYPMNATRASILSMLKEGETFDRNLEQQIWHLLYSTQTKREIDQSLSSKNNKENGIYAKLYNAGISDSSIEKIKVLRFYDVGYGAYSEKAIKKLLPLMRKGNQWHAEDIDSQTLAKINSFLNGENPFERIPERVLHQLQSLKTLESFQGLPEYLATYIVYGKHSEVGKITKWHTPHDIDVYLNTEFKQHSLRNPIVESVVLETLRVVRDLWQVHEKFDEIHIELGRDLKNPRNVRERMTNQMRENENTNFRIKTLLVELAKFSGKDEIKPYSPSQQEKLKIFESTIISQSDPDQDISDIIKDLSNPAKTPTKSQIERYKSWLEQKYRSPYTGKIIPLSRLFTSDYEIEHVIPQSRYFDDSFSNKVICEAEVNKKKDNLLGYEFIKSHHGSIIKLATGEMVKIFEVDEYEKFVADTYAHAPAKRKKLLMDEIPSEFINRQLNDSRYISKVVKSLLSNIVREQNEDGEYEQEAISKNIIACNGRITDKLKKDWRIGEVWNHIILPRFERLNQLTESHEFTGVTIDGYTIPRVPLALSKGFQSKRIDHRHHAMDAIVIACTTREHVQLLSTEAAQSENKNIKYSLSRKLRYYKRVIIEGHSREFPTTFKLPWQNFIMDVEKALQEIVISYKQNLRILSKATNQYTAYENGKKVVRHQISGDHFAIRKPLHKDTVYGEVNLQRIRQTSLKEAIKQPNRIVNKRLKAKVKELFQKEKYNELQVLTFFKTFAHEWKDVNLKKVDVFYFTDERESMVATRFTNDLISIFSGKKKKDEVEKVIEKITDTGIQKILTNYLNQNLHRIEEAFSPEGLDDLNRNITLYNNGKRHKPIYKVRLAETKGKKFAIGQTGNKSKKFVEAQQGTNLFFAIYQNDEGKRKYETIPLETVIERKKQKLNPVPEVDTEGNKLLFTLSPNDLVYVPTEDERINGNVDIDKIDKTRIYRFVSSSSTDAFFVPNTTASLIYKVSKEQANNLFKSNTIVNEYGLGSTLDKTQRICTNNLETAGEMIKEICIPLKVNRIGKIEIK